MSALDLNQADFLFESAGLDSGAVRVLRFSGREELSRPFVFQIELVSSSHKLSLEDPIGKTAKLTIRGHLPGGGRYSRYVCGVIEQFEHVRAEPKHSIYRATLLPSLATLGHTRDSRVFIEKSTMDIVKELLKDAGLKSDYVKEVLHETRKPRDFCVQYQETDLHFLQRLLENDGIGYFFEHGKDAETLVVGDGKYAFHELPNFSELSYYSTLETHSEGISDLRVRSARRPGKAALGDFRFKQPGVDLVATQQADAHKELEIYEYPGRYVERDMGDWLAQVRLDELQHDRDQLHALSNCRAVLPGYYFSLTNHPRAYAAHTSEKDSEYLIVSVEHTGTQPSALGERSGAAASGPAYQARLTCIPLRVKYRPPRRTPRPVIPGVQTATVVGPAGEEIHCDEHGRVKVQFHWDRYGKKDDSSSCWIRVSQPWGGVSFGGIFIPRIGQEVLVQFLEGDPDRPVIIGRVYNGENPLPYSLPDKKTVSTFKTQSSPGGGGSNELRFEDAAGSEEIFLHGQLDMNTVIERDRTQKFGRDTTDTVGRDRKRDVTNNETVTVGVDRSASVGSNETLSVGSNQSLSVGSNQTISVGSNQSLSVGSNQTNQIGANKTTTVGGSHTETVSGSMTVTVAQMLTETVGINYAETVGAAMELTIGATFTETVGALKTMTIGGALNESVGASHSESIGGSLNIDAGGGASLSAGKAIAMKAGKDIGMDAGQGISGKAGKAIVLDAGTKVTIVAADEIAFKTGSATIVLKSSGDISIKGSKISIKGSGDVVIKGSKIAQN